MKLVKFSEFQPSISTYTHKIGLVKEYNTMPELYGDNSASIVIQIPNNTLNTYQVFNRFPGSKFIPYYVSNLINTNKIKTPISVISPLSEIKTYQTRRSLKNSELLKGSLYFNRPKISEQYQVVVHEGKIIGCRKIIDNKPMHINLNRHPKLNAIKNISTSLYESLKADLIRFRVGDTPKGLKLLAMEDFQLTKPELSNLYFKVYEDYIGHMPEWFKHHIESTSIIPYLTENYNNRNELRKTYPYLL